MITMEYLFGDGITQDILVSGNAQNVTQFLEQIENECVGEVLSLYHYGRTRGSAHSPVQDVIGRFSQMESATLSVEITIKCGKGLRYEHR